MRSQPQVVVSLGPMRLDVARVRRGEIVSRASAWLDRVTLEQAWNTELHSLDGTLEQLLRLVEAPPGAATIIEYSSPETSVDVFTIPASENPDIASRKMLADASSLDLAKEPFAMLPLGSAGDGPTAQHHVLGAADQDIRTDMLRNWLRRAGLHPAAYVPLDAAAVQVAAARAQSFEASAPLVVVHLGERRTVIVLAHGGELKLVRCVGIGTSVLVDAAAQASASEGQVVDALQRKQAYETLRQSGISLHSTRGPRSEGADRLLPFLNPALQRYVIEIRQTLRFGLSPQDAARVVLHCIGAGNVLPGFARTLAAQLEVSVPEDAEEGSVEHPQTVDLGLSLMVDAARISLTPESHRRATQSRRAMQGLAAGAVVSAALVVGDGLGVWARIHSQLQSFESMSPIHEQLRQRAALSEQVAALKRQNAEIYRTIRQGLADQPDWKLVFAEVADATQERMKLTDITLTTGSGGATMSLRGVLSSGPADGQPQHVGATAQSAMGRFLATLSAAAAVESAELGETRIAEVQGVPVEVFAADVRLRGLPFILPVSGGR